MSGRGGVGTQQYGWRGGRGGRGGRGLGTAWYGGYNSQSGHGGFAGAGGGGGGGRRPWRGGDGPMGHKWENTHRDGRVQKNTGRGRGRGRGRGGRGRGGREASQGGGAANSAHTWKSAQNFQKQGSGEREQPEGVNYDASMNVPGFLGGLAAVDSSHRQRLMESEARQYEGADPRSGNFVGVKLDARNAHSLVSRATRSQPPGTRFNVRMQAVSPEDVAASSSELIKGRFLGALVTKGDPFKLSPDEDEEMADEQASTATENMRQQHGEENADEVNLEVAEDRAQRRPAHYKDA